MANGGSEKKVKVVNMGFKKPSKKKRKITEG